ncbi:hypothetical protein GIB67_008221 [Kingdonia uniflora]|uniref:1-phosphatidylinositol-4-phosphate 5-kinase n=1 Tax=Kingdonia uniflora TaxID=39325 RepID=A0A7J7N4X5_9MAGN|nr:hypothetical protein GIB67_008221 [Kingdonia uniflora]
MAKVVADVLYLDKKTEHPKVANEVSFSCIHNGVTATYGDGDEGGVYRPQYIMSDGCLYQGLWFQGKRKSGKDWIKYPSGATYVGDFHESYIHGYGSYTVRDCDSYDRNCILNKRHGFGKIKNTNKVVSEGFWSGFYYGNKGYIWGGGGLDVGQLSRVAMWGEGSLSVSGVQHRFGFLRFGDGRFLFGLCDRDLLVQEYQNHSLDVDLGFLGSSFNKGALGSYDALFNRLTEVFLRKFCGKLEIRNFQGCCELETGLEILRHEEDVLRVSASNLLFLPHGEDGGDMKKPGIVVIKGHNNYEPIRSLQLGIRHFLRPPMALPKRELSDHDFRSTKSTWIQFPKHAARRLPSGTVTEFEWKDYCPMVFRRLQELDDIDYADYVLSICGYETLRELSAQGKSGCLLYSSDDNRFVIKTMRKAEMKVLLKMLPSYYDHVHTYGSTLLTKFYGLHVVRPSVGFKVYYVVMSNILQSDLYIHRRFDLKGSSQGRYASKSAVNGSTTFKDLDLDLSFHLDPLTRHRFLNQIKHDCKFLEAEGIMDYSLLLGLHIESSTRGAADARSLTSGNSFPPDSAWKLADHDLTCCDNHQRSCGAEIKLGVKTPARAVKLPRNEVGSTSSHLRVGTRECYNVKLYFGIIDILQGYNVKKRIEHMYKSIQFDSQSISAVNPKVYSTRFQDFIHEVFPTDDLEF